VATTRRILLIAVSIAVAIPIVAAIGVYALFGRDGVRVALEQQATAWLGQPVAIGRATVHVLPRPSVALADVRVGNPVRVALKEVALSTGLRPLLSRRIEDAEITVADSRLDLPLPFTIPAAAGGGDGGATASSASMQVVSIRAIRLRNVTLASRGRTITVSAESSLSSAHLNLDRFTAVSGATSLEASGLVQLTPRLDAQLKIAADQVDMDDLVALADAFLPDTAGAVRSAAPRVPGRIVARVSAERGRAAGVDVQQFATTLVAQGNRVTMSPMAFQLFGGRYQGSLDVDMAADALQAIVRARISDIDVARLAAFGGVADAISGQLTGAGTFNGRGATIADAVANASGEGTATITNGAVSHLGLLRTIVLFFGRPAQDAGPSSDHFDRIDASFGLARRMVTARALSLHSSDVDLVGQGTLAVPTKAINGRFDVSLSESLSAQAGTDLARFTREGNRIVLPAVVSGTLEAPRVTIDAKAAISRGLRNEVQRRLKDLLGGLRPAAPE
jgi:hypothetical protein